MTRDEWETIALLVDNCWRGEFNEVQSSSYFTLLQQFSHGEVMAGLQLLIERGKPFVPSVPEIVEAIRSLQAPVLPSWSEVWGAMPLALKQRTDDEATEVMREKCGKVAAAFIRSEGIQRLKYVEFFDPQYGNHRVRELQQRWTEFADRSVQRLRNGHALEAAGGRRGTLGKIDPFGYLGDGE